MSIHITINGQKIATQEGKTILDVATDNGFEIPSFCHDDRVKAYGSCGICVVEVEGSARLLRACSTVVKDGMSVRTNTERAVKARKSTLELLLSAHEGDCRPPCSLACPAETDCGDYSKLIALGKYREANELIKQKLPLPSSIGRVCPRPCEGECRRKMVEAPVALGSLKYFVSDKYLGENAVIPECLPNTGKKIAIVGGGPGGLAVAYYLRQKGHAVTVFDAMTKAGGMLRYGIPEYRLPKKILNKEIAVIKKMGVRFRQNVKVGIDVSLDELRKKFDAVVLAIGAWSNVRLGCKGEDLDGVVGGIDFLRKVALGEKVDIGKAVAVVGGGNTAMDACRTAVRLGADKVYNVYRRTRAEMPAQSIEIDEAEEEGVIFKNLTNPIEIAGVSSVIARSEATKQSSEQNTINGIASSGTPPRNDENSEYYRTPLRLRLQKMKLGEPDLSGRRSPVAIEGEEEILAVNTVIIAIGQTTDIKGIDRVELTKRGTISADEVTFETNLKGVFSIGDATNKGANIAVSAIGEGRKAAEVIDKYLVGAGIDRPQKSYLVTTNPTADDYADYKKKSRVKLRHLPPEKRKTNFKEVTARITETQAKKEAMRCLECGCADFHECKLIKYTHQYNVNGDKYSLEKAVNADKDLQLVSTSKGAGEKIPNVTQTPDKCILCGLCVRICDEVVGAGILGLEGRGFDTTVTARFGQNSPPETCIDCGKCAEVCPTGALIKREVNNGNL